MSETPAGEHSGDYDRSLRGRLCFALHWLLWKIGKALYPPRRLPPSDTEHAGDAMPRPTLPDPGKYERWYG